jgi:hypothetical protein
MRYVLFLNSLRIGFDELIRYCNDLDGSVLDDGVDRNQDKCGSWNYGKNEGDLIS